MWRPSEASCGGRSTPNPHLHPNPNPNPSPNPSPNPNPNPNPNHPNPKPGELQLVETLLANPDVRLMEIDGAG